MRCLALAQAWLSETEGGQSLFLCNCLNENLERRILSAGISLRKLEQSHPDPMDLEFTLAVLEKQISPHSRRHKIWLALDGYHFDAAYQQTIHNDGYNLLVIDDAPHLPYFNADIILNQNIGAEHLFYGCGPNTRLLLGTRFALLRPEFRTWRNWKRDIPKVVRKVLVTFGSGDPDNMTGKVIRALSSRRDLKIRVILGPVNPNFTALCEEARKLGGSVEILSHVSNMAQLMAWADLAISAAGSTCWELAFMGLPSILIEVADNQKRAAEGLASAGFALNLGPHTNLSSGRLVAAFESLISAPDKRAEMARRGSLLVDGLGANRVTYELMHRPI